MTPTGATVWPEMAASPAGLKREVRPALADVGTEWVEDPDLAPSYTAIRVTDSNSLEVDWRVSQTPDGGILCLRRAGEGPREPLGTS